MDPSRKKDQEGEQGSSWARVEVSPKDDHVLNIRCPPTMPPGYPSHKLRYTETLKT